MVKRIAYHMMTRLPACVEVDDLVQAGLMGLLDAVDRFDSEQGAHFETYATQRVRGAMLDELRDADWATRNVRRAGRQIENTINTLQQRHHRPPSEQEIAAEMGLDIQAYFELLNDARGRSWCTTRTCTAATATTSWNASPTAQSGAVRYPGVAPFQGRAGQGGGRVAGAGKTVDGHVLRAGHEFQGNRRRAWRVGVARLPVARPGHLAFARPPARLVLER
jgi:RNA polymerase sigma factor (sigma-70 family)